MNLVERLRHTVGGRTLDHEAADEIERLNNTLRWEQNRSERIGTHGQDCHLWGPSHYECLLREYEKLQRIEQAARNLIAQKGRHNTEIAYKRLETLLNQGATK